MNNTQNRILQEDEIDLRELWITLVKHKIVIFVVIIVSTLIAIIFASRIAHIYSGSVLLEVGEIVIVNNQQTAIYSLDNINNLKEITTQATGVNANIPNGANNILTLSMESSNLSEIKTKLENAVKFVILRHQEKAKLYQNDTSRIRMTQVIDKMQISTNPIKPNKQLIITIGFISGLILGIFLAFLIEYISTKRN